ncbi:MAG: hypothetical protein ACOCU1_02285 [Bacillota bacterium]
MIETIINSCLHHQCLLSVTTHHPLTNIQSFIGMLSPENNTKDKIRIHLYDGARRVFLYDDMGKKMYATIQKNHIKNLTPIQNIIYPIKPTNMQLPHKTRLYNAYYKLRKRTIKKITTTKTHHLSRVFIHENILSIDQTSRTIPVLSYHLRFDAKTNTYDKQLFIHHEQPLHLFFYTVPNEGPIESLIIRFKTFIKSHISVDETPFTFIIRPEFKTIKPTMIMRPMHHPYKALNNVLTPKNLGRKIYLLPPLTRANSLMIQQTLTASLTHPVTLSYLPYGLNDITKAYLQSALVNQKNTLIIAPLEAIKSLTDSSLILPLVNHSVLDEVIDNFLNLPDKVPEPVNIKKVDYHDFFIQMSRQLQKADDVTLLKYLKCTFDDKALNEYAIRLDAFINQQETNFMCDISLLYTLDTYKDQVEAALFYYQSKQRAKLSLPLYKRINNVLTLKNKEKRRQEVLKWIHKPHILKHLKNIFPVIITDEHAPLYPYQSAFDMLVTYNIKNLSYHKVGLSSKITMILTSKPYLDNENKDTMFMQQYTLFDQYQLANKMTIKQFNMPNPLMNRAPIIHDVKAINCAKHIVYNHSEYIQKFRKETSESVAIRTPFHAQKSMLKDDLKLRDIQTIYVPTTKRMILSLPIHQHMPKQTYDWIKNHPSIESTLNHTPLDIIIDIDAMYHLTTHEDTLAKTVDFYHQSNRKHHYINIDQAIDILLSACLKASKMTVKEKVKIADVFTHQIISKLKTIPYYLQNHSQNIACIELPFYLTKSQYDLLHQASRQKNITLITYFSTHKHHIDRLIKILKTIDLIKAW